MRAALRPSFIALLVLSTLWLGLVPGGQWVVPVAAQSTSVGATANLSFDDPPLLPGGSKVGTIRFHHDRDRPIDVEIGVVAQSGYGDATKWIQLQHSGVVTVPASESWPLEVRVSVPSTAADGVYRAGVRFRLVEGGETQSQGTGATVQTAVTTVLHVEVDNDNQVQRVDVPGSPSVFDSEIGSVLQFSVPLENTGNVDVNPRVRLVVYDKFQERVVAVFWFNDTFLSPGESVSKAFLVEDAGLPMDQYWGIVEVYVGGSVVHTANAQTFDVVAAGALARRAELRTITIDGGGAFARVGSLLKLTAIVRNTGQAPLVAEFQGEVRRDGALVDTFSSQALEIPIGEDGGLAMFYTGDKAGRYEFIGRAHYGAKVTEEKSLIVTLTGDASGDVPWLWIGVAAAAVVGAFLLVAVLRRPRRQKAPPPGRSRRRGGGRPPGGPPPGRPGAPRPGRPPVQRGPGGQPPAASRGPPRTGAPPRNHP